MARLLEFFGVSYQETSLAEFLGGSGAQIETAAKCRLLCSARTFCQLLKEIDAATDGVRLWQDRVHSAFVYAGADLDALHDVVMRLSGGEISALRKLDRGVADWMVSADFADFCGVLSGVRVTATDQAFEGCHGLDASESAATAIISAGAAAAFVKFDLHTVPVFLSLSESLVDLDAELETKNFDIRDHLFAAAPAVMYVKWAFPETSWHAPETNACLVIDDPLLKPRYGFIRFHELLELMDRHNFSTNIAFIPWNWRRSHSDVVRLFRKNPDRFSLSIHGCDHTGGEFGTHDGERLRSMAWEATDRISRHETETGLRHDRVMVFPQGVFSEKAIEELKHANYDAVVNTEVIGTPPQGAAIKISDVWDVAVMRYGCFPIYTRRYPGQGIENFAFDILLGKPCIAVIHHDFCNDKYTHLIEFIDRLNALKCPLSWRSLGEVVKRGYRQRERAPGEMEVEMYGTELRLENRSDQRKHFKIKRRECNRSSVKEVRLESEKVAWDFSNGYVRIELELDPGQSATVKVDFEQLKRGGKNGKSIPQRLKTRMRRYLSEVRDNYLIPARSRFR